MGTSWAVTSMTLTSGAGGAAAGAWPCELLHATASRQAATAIPGKAFRYLFIRWRPSLRPFLLHHAPAQPLLVPVFEIFQKLLRAHTAGDELRALAHHRDQYSFPGLVDKGHILEIDDAVTPLTRAARVRPVGPQLGDPRFSQTPTEDPFLLCGCIRNRNLQHEHLPQKKGITCANFRARLKLLHLLDWKRFR